MKRLTILTLLSAALLAGDTCQDALHQVIYNKDQYLIGDSTEYAKRVVKYTEIAKKVCPKEEQATLEGTKERYLGYIKEDKRLGIRQHPIGYIIESAKRKENGK